LRSKVKIEDASATLAVFGASDPASLAEAGLAIPDERGFVEDNGTGIAHVAGTPGAPTPGEPSPGALSSGAPSPAPLASRRFWVIRESSKPDPRLNSPGSGADIESAWRLADIRAGLPVVYAATSEAFVAQMLNLDLLDGISFSKGCYTGQEIIARTQHLGRIKRRMFRLELPHGDWSVGGPVKLADGRTGKLVELVRMGAKSEALAVLSLEAAGAGDEAAVANAAAQNAVELPLPYSARLNAA
jgi:tRNA-modifying protein YgfZ